MNTTHARPPKELVSSFALELKRLATLVERSLRKGDDIAALSSLTAIAPLMESLSETVLKQIVADETTEEARAELDEDPASIPGYL